MRVLRFIQMSDETKQISVQIPSEVLKEVSTATEQAKATSDGMTLVTLHFSPEAVSSLTTLRKDFTAFEEAQVAGSHAAADRFIKTSEMRISFYEKLILLAGGSFSFSL